MLNQNANCSKNRWNVTLEKLQEVKLKISWKNVEDRGLTMNTMISFNQYNWTEEKVAVW